MWTVIVAASLLQLTLGSSDQRNFGHERVIDSLMQNYRETESHVRPAQNTTTSVGLALFYIKSFNKVNGRLTAGYTIQQSWVDSRLTWEDTSVTSIRLPSSKIWKPDWRVWNSVDLNANIDESVLPIISLDGTVLFIPPAEFTTVCKAGEFNEWDCLIKLGSWTHNAWQLPLTVYDTGFDHNMYNADLYGFEVENTGAEVVIEYFECCPEPYTYLAVTFRVRVIEGGVASGVTSLVSSALMILATVSLSRTL